MTNTNPVHAMVAGYMAGSSGIIVGYPLECLKVWVQTNSVGKNKHLGSSGSKKKSSRPKRPKDSSAAKKCETARGCSSGKHGSSGLWQTSSKKVASAASRRSKFTKAVPFPVSSIGTTTMAQQRATLLPRFLAKPLSKAYGTIRALYSGVTGPLVTNGMVQSVNFATYDATRRFLYRWQQGPGHPSDNPREYLTKDSVYSVALAGASGGVATATLTAPLLMIKIRQQIKGHNWRTAVREIFFVEGPSGVRFRPLRPYGAAFVPHVLSEATGRAIYMGVYEGSKRSMVRSKGSEDIGGLSLRERMLCGAMSGICSWGVFFPIDALRNRMYDAATRTSAKPGAGSIVGTLRAMHAERAFYRGYSISILRGGPVAAAVLPVYDLTLEKLSSWK